MKNDRAMTHFPNLPGPHNYQNRANLERACEELRYYAGRVGESQRISLKTRMRLLADADSLIEEIETARTDNAAELFSRARELCRDMEKILSLSK